MVRRRAGTGATSSPAPDERQLPRKARAALRRLSIPVASVGFGRGASSLPSHPRSTRGDGPAARNARPLRSAMAIPQWVSGTRLYPLVPPLPVLQESVTSGPPPFRGKSSCIPAPVDDGKPLLRRQGRSASDIHDDHAVVAHANRIRRDGDVGRQASARARSRSRIGPRAVGRRRPPRCSRTRPRRVARRRASTGPRGRTARRRSCRPRSRGAARPRRCGPCPAEAPRAGRPRLRPCLVGCSETPH